MCSNPLRRRDIGSCRHRTSPNATVHCKQRIRQKLKCEQSHEIMVAIGLVDISFSQISSYVLCCPTSRASSVCRLAVGSCMVVSAASVTSIEVFAADVALSLTPCGSTNRIITVRSGCLSSLDSSLSRILTCLASSVATYAGFSLSIVIVCLFPRPRT